MKFFGSINSFNGGLVDDIRDFTPNKFGLSRHFDIFSSPLKLSPYRSTTSEADATSAAHLAAFNLKHFRLGKNGLMYALGNDGSGHAQVYQKTDPTTGNWSASTTATSANALVYGAFIEWGATPALWMFTGTAKVSKWTIGSTFTDTVATVGTSIVTVAQPVIGADDNMYMFYNNKVVRVTRAGAVTDDVLTNLPSDMRITCAARWGTYIVIGMAYGTSATSSPTGVSKVFVWDLVTTTTVNDVIDWGEGALMVLANLEGRICGVSNKALETPSGLTSLAVGQGSMVVRMWNGALTQTMMELVGNQSVPYGRFISDLVVKDNKMYWVASVPLYPDATATESTYQMGIWAFGRKNVNSDFALTLDYVEPAVDSSNYFINSFGNAGNYWFINHSASFNITKTDSSANYNTTSLYESAIINWKPGLRMRHIPDSASAKHLESVTVTFEPLPASSTVVLKYRKDAETSWTQIFTYTVTSAVYHTSINIESTGLPLPTYKEIQFRVESTGGAVITGLKYTGDTEDKDIVSN